MPTSIYQWNARAGRYVGPDGRFVSRQAVRAAIDAALEKEKGRALALAYSLRDGLISLTKWREEMRAMIKEVHIYNAAIARGGFAQMTQSDWGNVGQLVRQEYGWLERFAKQIASGEQPLDGRFTERAKMYAEAGRKTFHRIETSTAKKTGLTQERNVLHPADHCGDCLGETAKGWVPIGTLIPIGSRQCRSRCRCTKEYQ